MDANLASLDLRLLPLLFSSETETSPHFKKNLSFLKIQKPDVLGLPLEDTFMAKLWEKGIDTDPLVMRFTVGDDYITDMQLVPADVFGSIAHARTLFKCDILTLDELHHIEDAFKQLLLDYEDGKFEILPEHEDVHTAVENYLVEQLGDLGKKIHIGRSRNDQAIVDMRIYCRNRSLGLTGSVLDAAQEILNFANRHWDVPVPGYTHTRAAMPSSIGLWAGAIGELLLDDLILLGSSFALMDQCPLGSAAGYGTNLKVDREFTSQQLGFSRPQKNTLAVQNSRGKFELALIDACRQIMLDLSRAAADIIFFSQPELGYIEIPDALTTGSSIMPNKKNPDVLELVRARTSDVNSISMTISNMLCGLLSGYNRDAQLTKAPTIRALDHTHDSLKIMQRMFKGLKVNADRCAAAVTADLYAADAAIEAAVQKNIPFRDAYRVVADHIENLETGNPRLIFKSRTHFGAPGNLGLDIDNKRIDRQRLMLEQYIRNTDAWIKNLLQPFDPEVKRDEPKEESEA